MTLRSLCHLIASTGWTPDYLDGLPVDELAFWSSEFVDYHNYMHRAPD